MVEPGEKWFDSPKRDEPDKFTEAKFPAKMIATQDRTFLPIKVLVLLVLKDNFKIKITNQVATSVL